MTERRISPPVQRALPPSDWPRADRETWRAAQTGAGILEEGGPASHMAARTRDDLTRRYAYYLHFLLDRGRLDHDGHPAASVKEENILAYVGFLKPRLSSVTLARSVYKITRVANCLAPGRDWRWLRRLCRRLNNRAAPRDKRHEVVEIADLIALGRELMDEAEQAVNATLFSRALLYRDGLIVALLATDPLRLANFSAPELGRTLIQDGVTWSFDIAGEETKTRRPHVAVLPDWISPYIDRYVRHYRPIFRNSETTNRIWMSRNGRPLAASSLARVTCKRTRQAFGKPISPHLFRSCLATSTARHHGAQIGLAMTVLGHRSVKVTERHYIQAGMIDALRDYQDMLLAETPE